ncbi:condensation domain-containing protein [Amycolatopsis sp. CB00013]|uniref:condensation domain-containing protein n=1 Tax=Amycolatopsis sp. CB00013 TaxID=1703945 RepID=UPI00093F4D8F|nr:condensation domain-containing protein [Amycolatopsis sp. CB00013]OKK01425.1 condensation protein [Amycolatopsis sp. CB00013]
MSVTESTAGSVHRFPLSLQQEFLSLVDHGDGMGPFGPMYTIVGGWRLLGELDVNALQGALDDLVARHEALRTRIVVNDGDLHQAVFLPSSADLVIRDIPDAADRERAAEEFLNDVEAEEFPFDEMPRVRLILGRFDDRDAVLVLVAHHTAVDGWSAQLVIRDLTEFYGARRDQRAPDLPEVRQLHEYVAWQRENANGPAVVAARKFWREYLDGARMVAIPTDLPRAEERSFVTGWHRFLLEAEFRTSAEELAAETKSTVFMVLLAAYLVYLRDKTGETDLVVPTFTPGRTPAWIQNTVSSFYNFVPLRFDIAECVGIREVIAQVRASCLRAYAHELPFMQIIEEAPNLMDEVSKPDSASCVFQVVQSPFMMSDEQVVGDLRITAMRRRVLSAPVGSQLPDGALWALELHHDGDIVGKIGYTADLFVEDTIASWVTELRRVLADVLVGVRQS